MNEEKPDIYPGIKADDICPYCGYKFAVHVTLCGPMPFQPNIFQTEPKGKK